MKIFQVVVVANGHDLFIIDNNMIHLRIDVNFAKFFLLFFLHLSLPLSLSIIFLLFSISYNFRKLLGIDGLIVFELFSFNKNKQNTEDEIFPNVLLFAEDMKIRYWLPAYPVTKGGVVLCTGSSPGHSYLFLLRAGILW